MQGARSGGAFLLPCCPGSSQNNGEGHSPPFLRGSNRVRCAHDFPLARQKKLPEQNLDRILLRMFGSEEELAGRVGVHHLSVELYCRTFYRISQVIADAALHHISRHAYANVLGLRAAE